MTLLGPDTIKAIEAHKRAERLAEIQRRQRAYQVRQMARAGYGWEDIAAELGVSREDARAAVLWGPK